MSNNTFDNTFVVVDENLACNEELPDVVDIELLVDRSGSMSSMYSQTINGVKEFIDTQKYTAKETSVKTYITIRTFDNIVEKMVDGVDINEMEIDVKYLKPRGTTRLIDTVCEAIYEQKRRLSEYTDNNVCRILAVLTDGEDNKSTLYSVENMKSLIEKQSKEGLVAMFLGANQDAVKEGEKYGFSPDHALTYTASDNYANAAFRSLSAQVAVASKGKKNTGFTELQRTQSAKTMPPPVNKNNGTGLKRTTGLTRS